MSAPANMAVDGPIDDDLRALVERSFVAHVATLDRIGRPVTWPMTPYLDAGGSAFEVSTGVTYPAKAERARRNPRVSMLLGGGDGPRARITALATVHDRDLQGNTDRFIREASAKTGAGWDRLPRAIVRAQAWHWVRIYITLTPVAVEWWPAGATTGSGRNWIAPPTAVAASSDPGPSGRSSGGWQRPPGPWTVRARYAAAHLGNPTLTVVRHDGFPQIVPTTGVELDSGGFRLHVLGSCDVGVGPACLTFDRVHGDTEFLGQENAVFSGTYSADSCWFDVERVLPDFSLPARGFAKHRAFISARTRLNRRLEAECARRGQPVPRIDIP